MSRLDFRAHLPNWNHRDTKPGKREARADTGGPRRFLHSSGNTLIITVIAVAAVDLVDDYHTDLAVAPAQNGTYVADRNVRVRAFEIESAVGQAESQQQFSRGAAIAGIVFERVGPTTVILVQPRTQGVELQATVKGTDGYNYTWPLVSNADGAVSFVIPAPATRPVMDSIVASTTSEGVKISSTARFVW